MGLVTLLLCCRSSFPGRSPKKTLRPHKWSFISIFSGSLGENLGLKRLETRCSCPCPASPSCPWGHQGPRTGGQAADLAGWPGLGHRLAGGPPRSWLLRASSLLQPPLAVTHTVPCAAAGGGRGVRGEGVRRWHRPWSGWVVWGWLRCAGGLSELS